MSMGIKLKTHHNVKVEKVWDGTRSVARASR